MPLSQELKDRVVREVFPKYPTKRAALMPTLWLAQQEQGWLASETFEEIGDLLELDPTDVMAVASFYTMFNRRPVGKQLIEVCENPPCWLNGAVETRRRICERLGLHFAEGGHGWETTPDGEYSVRPTECVAACDYAPAVQVNYRYYGPVRADDVEDFLANMDRFAFEKDGSTPAFGTHEPRIREGRR
jgi:NADH:ubiquinone oxidoreductase subunit E